MCRTLPGHSTRKHCQILPFPSLKFIQFSDNDCAMHFKCLETEKQHSLFSFLTNLIVNLHIACLEVCVDIFIYVLFLLQWNLNIACFSAGWSWACFLAGWSWAAFSQLNVITIIPESQTNKRFMKKQHFHVGMRAPITNIQVGGQPPQSFKAKRFEAFPLSNFEKRSL